MKVKHGWTDTSVDDILEYVKDLLPAGNTCPGSLAEAKRITCPLDLPHEKYHACINDYIMYRKEHVDKTKCPVCDVERYKKGKKKAPRKVVWYPPAGCNGVRVPFGYSGLISRYMDPKKRNFSGMKSHDCHVMMTQILPVAIRGIMDDHVRATLTGLCNFFDVITRKSISVKKLARLQEEIVVILCELEMYFPPAFFDVMVHLLVHIMDDIVSLGPAFLHNMMPFERMNGVIKGYVRNRSHPDGSIVQGWLTEECISFCTNYLDIEDPVGLPQNKHLRRFEGVGHKNGRKELHVHMSGRTSDFDRANLVALQHIDLIDPWLKEHKTMIENSGKPMIIWFTNDKKVLALEKKLEEERQKLSQCDEGSSSQASTGRVAWDKPLVRALNIVNEHSPTRRPHRGRVAGAGTGYKHGHYGLSSAADKNARSERKQREAEEMRESILAQVQAGLVPQLVPQLKATLVPEVKAEVAASVQADFNALHAWYEGGKQAPPKMQVVSFDGSNSMAPPSAGNDNVIMETPPAAGNVAGARDSPSMPGSSPSVTCTPAAACAGPSTLAELNALTALSTPCTFLMRVNGELKDVARGSILRPLDKKWHTRDMEDDVYRVEVDRALPGYEDLFPPNQPHGADDEDPLNLASLKGWVLLWPKTLIRINTYSGSTASKDKHLAAPQVSVPPRQPAAPVVSAPPQQPAAPVVSAPPQQPAAPVVSAPPQQPTAPEAEEYEREDFQWDIPTSSQVVHEDALAPKYGCSKKLFDSQETAEEENLRRSPPSPSKRC
ncbi:hypothetical protein QYE76_066583 [Lolium multiflorum]|uniref:DUF4218 domain-containing protein n=1 Tax=Lolium multiflorum TaxID=4521 RepID=A0AAD8SCK2_LOLMU|nr:hypothetical protein QYE76_066583 [Lolium multiflorum]